MKIGKWIVIDGPDCSGKSTMIEMLKNDFPNAVFVADPGSTELGLKLREILKYGKINICNQAELLLFTASRVQLLEEIIRPAINSGKMVFCDRYLPSTIAYQGYGRGFNIEKINALYKETSYGIHPNYYIILNISVDVWKKRKLASRGKEPIDRFEDIEGFKFMEKVIKAYGEIEQCLCMHNSSSFYKIDASRSVETVYNDIKSIADKIK